MDISNQFCPLAVYSSDKTPCYLYALKAVSQSDSYGLRLAVFGVLFDDTYALVSVRWFRVCPRGRIQVAHGTNCSFLSSDRISKNDPCYPPDVVLDYFRQQALGGACA